MAENIATLNGYGKKIVTCHKNAGWKNTRTGGECGGAPFGIL
jgi:hypothetical protein